MGEEITYQAVLMSCLAHRGGADIFTHYSLCIITKENYVRIDTYSKDCIVNRQSFIFPIHLAVEHTYIYI